MGNGRDERTAASRAASAVTTQIQRARRGPESGEGLMAELGDVLVPGHSMPPGVEALPHEAVRRLFRRLRERGWSHMGRSNRERVLRELVQARSADGRAARAVVRGYVALAYGSAERGRPNPLWQRIGYPGPPKIVPGPDRGPRKTRQPAVGATTAYADVCVVGSGAGGAVAAATLAEAGLEVIVLERGEVVRPADVDGLELSAYRRMFRGGGVLRSQDDHIGLMAGSCVGGGTVVNWCSCPDPPARVRQTWEHGHGLRGIADADFDRHLDAVRQRLDVNCRCSDLNGPNRRLLDGCQALELTVRPMPRNVDRSYYVPAYDGFTGFGDRSGAKNSAAVSFLAGATEAGVRIATGCTARSLRRLPAGGWRVEAQRRQGALSVRCRHVALGAGALDSPALLLRSGIASAVAGTHLRLHPSTFVIGFFAERQDPWWGPPQSLICEALAELEDGFGIVLEATQFRPGLLAAALPWHSGRDHARLMGRLGHAAQLIGFVRDHGGGRVTLGDRGDVRVRYPLRDPVDRRNIGLATVALARILHAAGARDLITAHTCRTGWRQGQSFKRFVEGLGPAVPGDRALFSLHQMGSCRLGSDPAGAVADPQGEVYGAPGIWIADASGFPEALGVNPMLTTMAMARRTAEAILAAR